MWTVALAGSAGMFVNTLQLVTESESLNSTAYVRFDSALNEKRRLFPSSVVPNIVGGAAVPEGPGTVNSTINTGLLTTFSREPTCLPVPGGSPVAMRIHPKFAFGFSSHLRTSDVSVDEVNSFVLPVTPKSAVALGVKT